MTDASDPPVFPELTRLPDDGATTCGYVEDLSPGVPGTDPCGRPGAWHIMWQRQPTGECAYVCEPHMEAVDAAFVYLDRHRIGPECGMPGSGWMETTGCVVV